MALISLFLNYFGSAYIFYLSTIAIFKNSSTVQVYENYPVALNAYSFFLMKWLFFLLYISLFEDFFLIVELLPTGGWFLLAFKFYLIRPQSEIHLRFFKICFNYLHFQEEFLDLSFYISLFSKHIIMISYKLLIFLVQFLKEGHLNEIEASNSSLANAIALCKGKIIQNQRDEELSDEFIHKETNDSSNVVHEEKSSNFNEEENKMQSPSLSNNNAKIAKTTKIVVNSKDLNKKKLGPLSDVLKAQGKKKTEKKKNNEKAKPKEKEEVKEKEKAKPKEKEEEKDKDKEKEKEIPKDTKKRFIEAGVFDALISLQTKEGSKLNPDLYQDFKVLVIIPEKTLIIKNLDDDSEFLRKPLKELKMISNVMRLIKIVYFTDDILDNDHDTSNLATGYYSANLKSAQNYDNWFLPISLFLQRENN